MSTSGVLVVPCYNEARRWDREYWAAFTSLSAVSWKFVDDGSADGTRRLIEQAASEHGASALCLDRNVGKAEAVRRGMLDAGRDLADGSFVGFLDADGAFSRTDVERLIASYSQFVESAGRFDAVWSSRVALAGRSIRRSTARHYIGRFVATLVSLGFDAIPYDTQSGLKLFCWDSRLRQALAEPFQTRWLFELEILNRWIAATGHPLRVWEEPLLDWAEVGGSKVTRRESVRIVRELTEIKRQQRQLTRKRSGM